MIGQHRWSGSGSQDPSNVASGAHDTDQLVAQPASQDTVILLWIGPDSREHRGGKVVWPVMVTPEFGTPPAQYHAWGQKDP